MDGRLFTFQLKLDRGASLHTLWHLVSKNLVSQAIWPRKPEMNAPRFFWFCRTWTKRYLITSQTRVKRVSRIHHRTIALAGYTTGPSSRMVRWCIRLTRLTLVCEVIRYRLVQVRQNQKKTFRVGGPQSPFSISSSFILSFVLLPFFLNTKMLQDCFTCILLHLSSAEHQGMVWPLTLLRSNR